MMRVADSNADAGVLTVRTSKGGKPRHDVLTDEGSRLFATLTTGKLGNELIFTRRDGGTLAQVAPIAADAGRLQSGEDQARGFLSRAQTYAWFDAGHAPNNLGTMTPE